LLKVDSRESNRVIEILQQLATVRIETLPIGDIESGKAIVEHKTLSDFISSLVNGRLDSQLARLAVQPKHAWLVIDGIPSEYERNFPKNINWKAVLGAIASVSVRYGVSVLWLPELRQAMYVAVRICEKADAEKIGIPRRVRLPIKTLNPAVNVVSRALQIPTSVAEELLARYQSPRTVFSLKKEDFLRIKGIGSVRATRIVSLLDNKYLRESNV